MDKRKHFMQVFHISLILLVEMIDKFIFPNLKRKYTTPAIINKKKFQR